MTGASCIPPTPPPTPSPATQWPTTVASAWYAPGGATAQLAAGTHPLDESIGRDARFLYVNSANAHAIDALAIHADGSLSLVGAFGALPAGTTGLIAP